uniref:Sister chromatid cohesion protein DCC1 n=1 Tax=Heterorhabditis bacteriophora TaxID=37862 RepID=A0A1I7XVC8_HETBA
MLRKNELGWDWETEEESGNTYDLTDLLNNIQMSKEQITNALSCMPVVEHKGKLNFRFAIVSCYIILQNYLFSTNELFSYSFLDGLCIIDETVKGKYISYLNVEDLPEDPRERMKLLFERKQSWLMSEITPFLSDICGCAKAMSGLMVSHCYSTKNDAGEKIFCGLRAV